MNGNVPNSKTKQEQNKAAGLMSYTGLKKDHAILHIFTEHTLEEIKI